MQTRAELIDRSNVLPGAYGRAPYMASLHPADVELVSRSPIDGLELGRVQCADAAAYERVVTDAVAVFQEWRTVPAPERGQIVRQIASALRDCKSELGRLVSSEVGKLLAEGEGEIQEAIDIADLAVGLSRQLCGATMHSERREHRMFEQWHPLGVVGVITAFNFPAAVWAWNSLIAAVCGDVVVWKPSPLAPLTAIAINNLCRAVARPFGFEGVFSLVLSEGAVLGERIADDPRIPLVSATGSCRMGRAVATRVAQRLGRSILELGGNNAVIVLADADFRVVIPSILFGAVGTAGQRCTSIRRVLVQAEIFTELRDRLIAAYGQVRIGDPREPGVLMGPLINQAAVDQYRAALARVVHEGGQVVYGGRVLEGMPTSLYVEPTIVVAHPDMPLLREETFAPIVYLVPVQGFEQALELNNSVPQGLSSALFTQSMRPSERFLSVTGSDCGIANVNMGPSGAEIGGAFGGEKETGGGREAGSDAWKQYMRRQTCTVNFGTTTPLAQGIRFGGIDNTDS